jgi:hypothetical protein
MVERLRLTLLISLAVLTVILLWRRFKQRVMARDLPAPLHAEVLSVQVAYHPDRLRVELALPAPQEVYTALLDAEHRTTHSWPARELSEGTHVVELPLDGRQDGVHLLELATSTQRTIRRFTIRRA